MGAVVPPVAQAALGPTLPGVWLVELSGKVENGLVIYEAATEHEVANR